MFIPLQYAMETRSYAQSIFLSCFSSLLFFSYVRGRARRVTVGKFA